MHLIRGFMHKSKKILSISTNYPRHTKKTQVLILLPRTVMNYTLFYIYIHINNHFYNLNYTQLE